MKLIHVGRLNATGEAQARQLFIDLETVEHPSDRLARARAIILDPELCERVEGAGLIDLDTTFATSLDFASHAHAAISPLGSAAIRDRGINLFLYLAYADQLIKSKARKLESYFLDEKTKGGDLHVIRNYRNTVFVLLSFFNLHSASSRLLRTFLGKQPNELGNALEKIAQNNVVMGSTAAMELVAAMFFDPQKGGYRAAPSGRKGSKVKSAATAMQELSSVVFSQCSRNYDVGRMDARQLLKLVPSTIGLDPWKRAAEQSFAAEDAAPADEEAAPAGTVSDTLKPSGRVTSHVALVSTLEASFGKKFTKVIGQNSFVSDDGSIRVKAAYASANENRDPEAVHVDIPGSVAEHTHFAAVRVADGCTWLIGSDALLGILDRHKQPIKPRWHGDQRWNVVIKCDANGDWLDRDRSVDLSGYRVQAA